MLLCYIVYFIALLIDKLCFLFIDWTVNTNYNNHMTYRQNDDWTYHFEITPVSDHMIY